MSTDEQIRNYIRDLYRSPVKHFVRTYGWLPAAQQRVTRLRALNPGRFARYFTFPGEFAIDVLLLAEHGIIEENQTGFPGVVFCEMQSNTLTEINKRLGKCLGVFPFPFEKAVLTKDFARFCPFDILNLDLTKEIFPKDGKPESSTIRAIEHLLTLHQGKDFDLYVTFKSSRHEMNPDAITEFTHMVDDNFDTNQRLREAFVQSCGMGSHELLASDFTLFWCKSFPKWILEQGIRERSTGSVIREYVYRRRPPHGREYDIVTFLFSFEHSGSHYMSSHRLITQVQNEIRRSFSILPTRVDDALRTNNSKQEELREDADRLLQKPPKMNS